MNGRFIDDNMIGNPDVQSGYYDEQTWNDSCAVAAEASIIRQFGIDLNEGQAAYISAQHGWYQPGAGTSPDVIGNMMDLYDISNHSVSNATISDLAQELSQGHGVIVGVRSEQLWDQGAGFELKNFLCKAFGLDNSAYMPADHAIIVTGIDVSDPDNPMVLINDSGVPDGAAQAYPLDRFMDAWENSNFYYTATDAPLPSMTGELNTPEWESINWGRWIGLGIGAATLFATADPELSMITGAVTESILNNVFADESFVRNV